MTDLIIVKAKFKVLTEEEGVRRTNPIFSGYRPNHISEFLADGTFKSAYMGDITLIDREKIFPGEEVDVIVRFLKRPQVEDWLRVGKRWFINEAQHRIGEAVILEIIQS